MSILHCRNDCFADPGISHGNQIVDGRFAADTYRFDLGDDDWIAKIGLSHLNCFCNPNGLLVLATIVLMPSIADRVGLVIQCAAERVTRQRSNCSTNRGSRQ